MLFINQVEIHTSNCIVFVYWHWWNLITIPFMIKCLRWEPRSLMQYTLNNFHVIAEFDKFYPHWCYTACDVIVSRTCLKSNVVHFFSTKPCIPFWVKTIRINKLIWSITWKFFLCLSVRSKQEGRVPESPP